VGTTDAGIIFIRQPTVRIYANRKHAEPAPSLLRTEKPGTTGRTLVWKLIPKFSTQINLPFVTNNLY